MDHTYIRINFKTINEFFLQSSSRNYSQVTFKFNKHYIFGVTTRMYMARTKSISLKKCLNQHSLYHSYPPRTFVNCHHFVVPFYDLEDFANAMPKPTRPPKANVAPPTTAIPTRPSFSIFFLMIDSNSCACRFPGSTCKRPRTYFKATWYSLILAFPMAR